MKIAADGVGLESGTTRMLDISFLTQESSASINVARSDEGLMENKRFQIFVSSTYEDLKEERYKVFDSIMKLGHIPAGMEDFPAFDDDQLDYIKRVIDDSDYYVLIIAGRYGSLSEDGLSFTEKEYDYAAASGKTVLAFIHGDADNLPVGKTDKDGQKLERLNAFKERVKKAGRNVKFWKDQDNLALLVSHSLTHAFRAKPGVGWVRGNVAASVEILTEINILMKENAALKTQLGELRASKTPLVENIANLDEETSLRVSFRNLTNQGSIDTYTFTWGDIFKVIGPNYMVQRPSSEISDTLVSYLRDSGRARNAAYISVVADDVSKIVIQMISYTFLEIVSAGLDEAKPKAELLRLTELGKSELIKMRTVRSQKPSELRVVE